MNSNVLYFPYISVPQSAWATRMLLYWDSVSAIVPMDFWSRPKKLTRYMQELLQADLVRPINPGGWIYEIPGFTEEFFSYLSALENELDERRASFSGGQSFRIHAEKMSDISDGLVDMRLARPSRYPWFDVEVQTGHEFMGYLAAGLSSIEQLDMTPATDTLENMRGMLGARLDDLEVLLSSLRDRVLERVLPGPSRPISPEEIGRFKMKNGEALSTFRRYIETKAIELASLAGDELRDRRLELLRDEVDDETRRVAELMKNEGWGMKAVDLVGAGLSEFTPLGKTAKITSAIRNLFKRSHAERPPSPMAYAAFARHEVLHT